MSYVALYRKWRPKTFTDVVGQHQVSDTLMRAIREDKVAHAYLFSGPRGTGKTSMAKIFGRAMNCEHGPTDTPCNECESCRQILRGQSLDVLEIDAASNRGIDEIRSLREQVNFMPVLGRKKIFIIDEAHMLTTEAWNALLKTIEEPPNHVIFIFATTEIEKLPVTIVSRCQRYAFRRITTVDIVNHLQYVARESHISLDTAAAQLIAVHADGGLRDALSILDQCSGMATDAITPQIVEEMIGLVSKDWIISLLHKLYSGDGAGVLLALQQALQEGRDARQIVDSLIEHLRSIIVSKVMPDAEELMVYDGVRDAFEEQVKNISIEEINRYIMKLQSIQSDAKWVDQPRIVVEVGLLSMLSKPRGAEGIDERIDRIERQISQHSEGMMDRLAKLEQGIPAGIVTSNVPVAPLSSSMHTVEISSAQNETVTTVSTDVQRLPQKGKVLPKRGTSKVGLGAVGTNKAQGNGLEDNSEPTLGLSSEITTSKTIRGVHEYRTIHGNVIKWLKSHNMRMCATFYNNGEIVYIDNQRVVVVFKQASTLPILKQERQMSEANQAFSAILGYSVSVNVLGASSPEATRYREIAQGANHTNATHTSSTISTVEKLDIDEPTNSMTENISIDAPTISTAENISIDAPTISDDLGKATVSGQGAGSRPTNTEGIIDDFLTVYEDPDAVLSSAHVKDEDNSLGGQQIISHIQESNNVIIDIESLPKWEGPSEEELRNPLLSEALSFLKQEGHEIYVEEVHED